MEFASINVDKAYVEDLINSSEFKKYVTEEAYEDSFDESCVEIEETEHTLTYKYVVDGELCFKNVFYLK